MSAADVITVAARWQVGDGHLDEVLELVAQLAPASLAEPGCLGYEVYRGVDAPGSLLLLERYRDAQALEAHRQSPHYQALVLGRILPLLAARRVELLQERAPA
jgi:quinol monooxygenase YgiN